MFGSGIIDVAIGVILVYLFLTSSGEGYEA